MSAVYTSEEVAKHNTKNDLWVSIHNKVYDVSSYLEDHPGGVPSLIEVAGQNATQAFDELGHSDHAVELLQRFHIGKLDHEEEDVSEKIARNLLPEQVVPSKSFSSIITLNMLVEVLTAAIAIFVAVVLARRLRTVQSFVSAILPWITSASLVSIFIQRHLRHKSPVIELPPRPKHFKVDDSTGPARRIKKTNVVLTPSASIELPITSIEKLSDNSNKITLTLPTPESIIGLPTGQHVNIRTTINDKDVSRAYTPTSCNKDLGRLELVIKNYNDGLMTGAYLQKVKVGDKLSISGPKGQMHYRRGLAEHICMIAGGSGITPMYQLIRAICEDPKDNTKITLIYSNQREEDILLKTELDTFVSQHGDQLQIHYLLSKPCNAWSGRTGRCTQQLLEELKVPCGNDKMNKAMLCGPPGLVDSAKEWLVNMGYDKTSTVSKMRDQVFVF